MDRASNKRAQARKLGWALPCGGLFSSVSWPPVPMGGFGAMAHKNLNGGRGDRGWMTRFPPSVGPWSLRRRSQLKPEVGLENWEARRRTGALGSCWTQCWVSLAGRFLDLRGTV